MRTFLLGVLAGLLVVVVALGAVLVAVSRPATSSGAPGATPATGRPPAGVPKGETWLRTVRLDSADVLTGQGEFTNVHATGSDIRMTAHGLRAGTLSLDATLPFATAARQVGGGTRLYAAGPGLAGIERTVTALGRTLDIRATGTVSAQGGQLVIDPRSVDLGGPPALDAALSAAARALVSVRHTVQGLPAGMQLTKVTVGADGFHVHLDGTAVALSR